MSLQPGRYYFRTSHLNANGIDYLNIKINYHSHSYNKSYSWKNNSLHIAFCECGFSREEGHAVTSGSQKCVKCKGTVGSGFIEMYALVNKKNGVNN